MRIDVRARRDRSARCRFRVDSSRDERLGLAVTAPGAAFTGDRLSFDVILEARGTWSRRIRLAPTTRAGRVRDRRDIRCVRQSSTPARRFLAWQSRIPVPSLEDDAIERVILQSQLRPRLAAHLRPVASRARRRRRGRAVVHGAVRPRLAPHRADVAAGRPHARPRHAAHARRPAGHPSGCRLRGAARSHPARGTARRHDEPRARRRLASTTARPTRRRSSSWSSASSRRWGGLPDDADDLHRGRRPGARVDRALRRPRRRRLRGVRAAQRARPRQPGVEGLVGRHHVRRRVARSRAHRALRGAGLRVRGVPRARDASRAFRGDDALAAEWDGAGGRPQARVQRAVLAARPGLLRARPRRGQATRRFAAPRTWATACGRASSTTTRPAQVAERLLSDQLFTGWGVRTLASDMGAYNPASYHNGSVWPHDNAIVAAGLMRYGFVEEANRIVVRDVRGGDALRRPAPRAVLRIRTRAVPRAGLVSGVLLTAGLGRRDARSRCSAPRSASTRRCPRATSGSRRRHPSTSATSTCATCRSRAPGSPWTPHAMAPRSSAFRPASPCTRCHALYRLRCPFEGTRHENRHHRTTVDPHPADRVRRHRVVHRHAGPRAARGRA